MSEASSSAPTPRRQARLACAVAFDKAKETAAGPHLRAANEWFAACARPTCARSLRQRCAVVHARVAALLPSIVPVVTDVAGGESRDVQVKMDGELLTSKLDGTPIVVDPGDHEFTFAKDGEVFATRSLALEKGQRHQIVSVLFQPRKNEEADPAPEAAVEEPAAAPAARRARVAETVAEDESADEEPTPRLVRRKRPRAASVDADQRTGAPWSAYGLAGVGLLGVGGYAVFNLKGSADNDALAAFCKPDCDPTSVRHVRNLYLAADISLGIGVAALLASTYLFLSSDSAEEESPRSRPRRSSRISRLGVAPTSSGAVATVGGTF